MVTYDYDYIKINNQKYYCSGLIDCVDCAIKTRVIEFPGNVELNVWSKGTKFYANNKDELYINVYKFMRNNKLNIFY